MKAFLRKTIFSRFGLCVIVYALLWGLAFNATWLSISNPSHGEPAPWWVIFFEALLIPLPFLGFGVLCGTVNLLALCQPGAETARGYALRAFASAATVAVSQAAVVDFIFGGSVWGRLPALAAAVCGMVAGFAAAFLLRSDQYPRLQTPLKAALITGGIAFGVPLSLALFFAGMGTLMFSSGMCVDTPKDSVSPDGVYVATVTGSNCGMLGDSYPEVTLRPRRAPFGLFSASAGNTHDYHCTPQWRDSRTLSVTGPAPDLATSCLGVRIKLEDSGPEAR